ncbi:MAG: aminoglycoside 3'-phosphotransferase [Candidatus Cloacimonetes bacterium]|nr:aminoglycoside 3'-phosphotransferase [Candidatus Cloacimonadota bacterium]
MKKIAIKVDASLFPDALRAYLNGARCHDSSCSEAVRTIFIDGPVRAYLKINKQGSLVREMKMIRFMHHHGLAPGVLEYVSENGLDYLLTVALAGEDGIWEGHLSSPGRLAGAMGEYLRLIHNLPVAGCPYTGRSIEMYTQSRHNINRGYADRQIIPEDLALAAKKLDSLRGLAQDNVVIHGDYCLPNIIMRDFELSGFVDLGTGGVGDRHYDLFWGIWTLRYNLKTDTYRDTFLDAYGRMDIDNDRMELCRLLAGFTE